MSISQTTDSQEQLDVVDHSSLHHYRTEIPNIIFQLGLSAYEISLYLAIKRTAGDRGWSFIGTKRLAKESGMSEGKVSQVKKDLTKPHDLLNGKSLITITKRKREDGGNATDLIEITDVL